MTTLSSQTFSIITEENHPYFGCVALANAPIDTLKKEDLQVFLFPYNPDNPVPPIVGNWTEKEEYIYFRPLIPFSKNLTYQARFPNLPYFTFKPVPPKNYTLTKLTHIYPSLTQLPENTLKMYLHFSAPMSDGNGYDYMQLIEANGNTIKAPFLDLKPLLWNEDRTRLTLWFDPGRVKRELLRNQKLGAPLAQGKNYTLHISKNWKDANGYSLAAGHRKEIEVTVADRVTPVPKEWTIIAPKANTKAPVIIHFGEALDHALATKSLTVYTKKGKIVKGRVTLKENDTQWIFTPSIDWQANPYRIQIKAELEDLAGNNLNRLFDTDLEKQTSKRQALPYYYVDFRVE
ncbi:MAG: Ig-like domain-containing protein [Saprospiraceae bacterium]